MTPGTRAPQVAGDAFAGLQPRVRSHAVPSWLTRAGGGTGRLRGGGVGEWRRCGRLRERHVVAAAAGGGGHYAHALHVACGMWEGVALRRAVRYNSVGDFRRTTNLLMLPLDIP